MRPSRLLPLLLALPLAAGAAPAPKPSPDLPLQKELGQSSRAFATDVYGKVVAGEGGNVFFSPASITVALAMTLDGARGETATQMSRVLHLGAPADGVRATQRRQAMMGMLRGTKSYELRVANKLWPQAGYPFEAPFLEVTDKEWGARAEPLDFVHATEPSRVRINAWVKDQTSGKIVDLIPAGALSDLTRMVLTNAIYFKGKWAHQFDKKLTTDQPFFAPAGQVKAPLMVQHGAFGYAAVDGVQLVSLPYQGGDLDMVLIVPDRRDGLAAAEHALLGAGTLDRWLSALADDTELDLSLPRFKATFAVNLTDVLKKLGMPLAFDADHADLTGMARPARTGEPPLYISAILHKAFIDVNEEGTEAAAATAVIVMTTDAVHPPPPVVRADHPFVYLLRDRRSGAVLFMGRVVDPTRAQ